MDKKYFPKVSIITPVKNSENTLKKTILSVLDQTYQNIEYILVHGKSSDKTSEVIKQFQSKNILVVEEEDSSIADAMNKAHQEVLEALHIMQSTIEYFEDAECLQFNKERMIKYLNKFSKDEVLSER